MATRLALILALLCAAPLAIAQQCGGSTAQGTEAIGGTPRGIETSVRGHNITLANDVQSGTFQVCAYVNYVSGTNEYQAAVIDPADGTTVLAESAVRTDIGTAAWYAFTGGDFTTYAPTTSTNIDVVVGSNSSEGNIYFQTPGATSGQSSDNGASVNPVVVNGDFDGVADDAGRDYSLHIEYTIAGGGGVTQIFSGQDLSKGFGPHKSQQLGGILD